ncbi:MAG TPA: PHP-associated domain-containing protein [Nitrososphaera sp.]|nr:PHP-associated domain-containing protein [Nitrososphaera sp.]
MLNAELHCHNTFSNHQNGSARVPFDCGVEMAAQLQAALAREIDVLFVTNHNTLDGYHQIQEYQSHHENLQKITIYPAEEVTIDTGGHVLAYGIHRTIQPGMTLDETLDEIKRQGAVSCAAHPFAVSNGIREKASMCDMIESFNSNNVDRFSNIVASKFAHDNSMPEVAGSDSHVLTTLGKCINTIEAENNLDSILDAMLHRRVKVACREYASHDELYEHAYYIMQSSRELLLRHALENYPRFYWVIKWALDSYLGDYKSPLWRSVAAFSLFLTKRVSEKVNMKGHSPHVFSNRQWAKLIKMSLMP